MDSLGDRLKKARERAGYETAADAARALGVKEPTYSGHENGSRGFRAPTGKIYARRFKVPFSWLMAGEGEIDAPVSRVHDELMPIPVVGTVEAGVWREPNFAEDAEAEYVPFPDIGYPREELYVLEVNGTSANQIAPPGSRVVCCKLGAVEPRDGDLVHVRRERAGAFEDTLKRLHVRSNAYELRTVSYDQKWKRAGEQTIVPFDATEADAQTQIVGIIVYEIRAMRAPSLR